MTHNKVFLGSGCWVLLVSGFVYGQAQPITKLADLIDIEKLAIERVAGAVVYKMPLISKINVRDMQLFPHYKPNRAAAGWTHAYIEFPTPTTARVWVEEIPPRTFKLIGRRDTGMYVFMGVSGKGYTEFRDDVKKPGKGVVWTSGERFYMPFDSWYGHANPFDEPARILVFAQHMDDGDILNPYIGKTRTVPEQTFPGERRAPIPEDDVIENFNWDTAIKKVEQESLDLQTLNIDRRGPARTVVYKASLGATLNVSSVELPFHHKKLRAKTGWKGIHIDPAPDLGHRAHFTNLQEIPPHSEEIGHKHSGGVWFMGVRGRGYTALRATADSPETRVYWGKWDLWCLPWFTAAGTWHSHANPYDEAARFMGEDVSWDNDGLLNARVDRVVHFAADGVGFGTPDKVFRQAGEAPPENK